jgi:hypothetical protein
LFFLLIRLIKRKIMEKQQDILRQRHA